MYNEKELLDKMNKNKDYRTKVLIDLNVALRQVQKVTADEYDEWEKLEEYKIAVVSLEIERKTLENQLKQANASKEEQKIRKELIQKKRDMYKTKYKKTQQKINKAIEYIENAQTLDYGTTKEILLY